MKKASRKSPSLFGPVTLVVVGVVLLVLAIVIVMRDSDESDSSASPANSSSNEPAAAQNLPYPDVPRVSLAEAKSHYDAETAIFVDVRSVQEYEAAHIPGALALPESELLANHQQLPADALIVLYCT